MAGCQRAGRDNRGPCFCKAWPESTTKQHPKYQEEERQQYGCASSMVASLMASFNGGTSSTSSANDITAVKQPMHSNADEALSWSVGSNMTTAVPYGLSLTDPGTTTCPSRHSSDLQQPTLLDVLVSDAASASIAAARKQSWAKPTSLLPPQAVDEDHRSHKSIQSNSNSDSDTPTSCHCSYSSLDLPSTKANSLAGMAFNRPHSPSLAVLPPTPYLLQGSSNRALQQTKVPSTDSWKGTSNSLVALRADCRQRSQILAGNKNTATGFHQPSIAIINNANDGVTVSGSESGQSSPSQVAVYKYQHGYLPTPSASSSGLQAPWTNCKSSLSSTVSTRSRSNSDNKAEDFPGAANLSVATAAAGAVGIAAAAQSAALFRSMSQAQATDRAASGGMEAEPLMPALPPGAVPTFGHLLERQSSSSSMDSNSSTAVNASSTNVMLAATALGPESPLARASIAAANAAASAAAANGTSSHAGSFRLKHSSKGTKTLNPTMQQHQQRQQADAEGSSYTDGRRMQYTLVHVQKPITLAPASQKGPVLMAVSPRLAPAMQRNVWCMKDFILQKRLYDGYASTIYKAYDRLSNTSVVLKLYHLSKLNSISSHQVAREVRLHMCLDHQNIISLHAAFQENGSVVLVQVSLPLTIAA
eukprot:GHRR01022217.1.p1 GENE.GHRR01022217.1~~GHRR01022217.1.p1  ORF type:complete len:645 (+),score=207.23 GHRR01022217.1:1136-3070(+)